MCKSIAEGGPCKAHREQALTETRRKHEEGLSAYARESGEPIDAKATADAIARVEESTQKSITVLERENSLNAQKGRSAAVRSKKLARRFNAEREEAEVEHFASEQGLSVSEAREILPVLAEYKFYKDKGATDTGIHAIDDHANGVRNERMQALASRMRELGNSSSTSLSQGELVAMSREMPPLAKRSVVSFAASNSAREFREAKDISTVKTSEIAKLQKTTKTEVNRLAKNPIVKNSDAYRENYEKSFRGIVATKEVQKAQASLKMTSGYIEEAHQATESARNNGVSEEDIQAKYIPQLRRLHANRAIMLGQARGLSPVESVRQYSHRRFSDADRTAVLQAVSNTVNGQQTKSTPVSSQSPDSQPTVAIPQSKSPTTQPETTAAPRQNPIQRAQALAAEKRKASEKAMADAHASKQAINSPAEKLVETKTPTVETPEKTPPQAKQRTPRKKKSRNNKNTTVTPVTSSKAASTMPPKPVMTKTSQQPSPVKTIPVKPAAPVSTNPVPQSTPVKATSMPPKPTMPPRPSSPPTAPVAQVIPPMPTQPPRPVAPPKPVNQPPIISLPKQKPPFKMPVPKKDTDNRSVPRSSTPKPSEVKFAPKAAAQTKPSSMPRPKRNRTKRNRSTQNRQPIKPVNPAHPVDAQKPAMSPRPVNSAMSSSIPPKPSSMPKVKEADFLDVDANEPSW